MSEKRTGMLNIGKALLGVSFSALAAIGSAYAGLSGDYLHAALWAGLTVVPAASVPTYDLIKDQVTKLISQNKEQLEFPIPTWWVSDIRSWRNVCDEIGDR